MPFIEQEKNQNNRRPDNPDKIDNHKIHYSGSNGFLLIRKGYLDKYIFCDIIKDSKILQRRGNNGTNHFGDSFARMVEGEPRVTS